MKGDGHVEDGSFLFLFEWLDQLEGYTDAEQDEMFGHAVRYAVRRVMPEGLDRGRMGIFRGWARSIDRLRKKKPGAGGGPPAGTVNNPWGKKGAPLTLAPVGDHAEDDAEWANYMKFLVAVAKAAPTFARARRDVVTTYAEFRALKGKYGSERIGDVILALGGPYDWKRNKKPMTMVIDEWCMRQVRKEEKGT